MARFAAVKYSQFARGIEPFSMQGQLPPSSCLLDDARLLLDMRRSSDPLSNWWRGFDYKKWAAREQPACLWRARNGWLIVHISTPACWRDFCATYLNRTIRSQVCADEMWRSNAVHELVTTIFSTHDVNDAAMTCQLYDIPAAVVRYATPCEAGLQASHIDWAVLSANAMEVHQIFNRGVSNGK